MWKSLQRKRNENEQAAKMESKGNELDTIRIMDMGAAATMMEEKRKFEQVGGGQGGRE